MCGDHGGSGGGGDDDGGGGGDGDYCGIHSDGDGGGGGGDCVELFQLAFPIGYHYKDLGGRMSQSVDLF